MDPKKVPSGVMVDETVVIEIAPWDGENLFKSSQHNLPMFGFTGTSGWFQSGVLGCWWIGLS